jgi:hypothetical protein
LLKWHLFEEKCLPLHAVRKWQKRVSGLKNALYGDFSLKARQ